MRVHLVDVECERLQVPIGAGQGEQPDAKVGYECARQQRMQHLCDGAGESVA